MSDMKTQSHKYVISFTRPVEKTFLKSARKNIVRKGKASRTLSRDIDRIVYGV